MSIPEYVSVPLDEYLHLQERADRVTELLRIIADQEDEIDGLNNAFDEMSDW